MGCLDSKELITLMSPNYMLLDKGDIYDFGE